MSPEQQQTREPTIQQDIYAIGALLVNILTALYPARIHTRSVNGTAEYLAFLLGDKGIANVVANCLNWEPAQRTPIAMIKSSISEYKSKLSFQKTAPVLLSPSAFRTNPDLNAIITKALKDISHPDFLNTDGYWFSTSERQENNILNRQYDVSLSTGWKEGVAGPLWLISKAKYAGFDVDSSETPYRKNWQFLCVYLNSPS
jgi:hypothetical protein